MSAVDDLMERKKNGFDFGILGRAILELAEDQANTDELAHTVAGWAENAQDRCEKLEERVKALEDLTKRHLRLHIKEELVEPPTAPDLDAKIIDCLSEIESWYSIQRKPGPTINIVPSLGKILRAFAGELGVK